MERGFYDSDGEVDADYHQEWENLNSFERTWETLTEDDFQIKEKNTLENSQYHRKRHQNNSSGGIQKTLIRHLYIVIDVSRAASRTDCAANIEAFIKEFLAQNPLSKIGLITLKDGVAHCIADLGSSSKPYNNINALLGKCSGDASLQNGLDLVHGLLSQTQPFVHREALIVFSSLSSCDPGNIMETVEKCKESKIRCSIIGLAAEMYICKYICQETCGVYSVGLDESHLRELVFDHVLPSPAIKGFANADLIEMGFAQRVSDGAISICSSHGEVIKEGEGYTCPRCKARVCELLNECCICGLTLVSVTHLARSYHHLFPITPFKDVVINDPRKLQKNCFGCNQSFLGTCVSCPKCEQYFCTDCDSYIHESLHNCPGCEIFIQSINDEGKKNIVKSGRVENKRKHDGDEELDKSRHKFLGINRW